MGFLSCSIITDSEAPMRVLPLCVQAAANWLLESDPAHLERQQQQWERDMQQREQEQQAAELQKKRQKKLIVEK